MLEYVFERHGSMLPPSFVPGSFVDLKVPPFKGNMFLVQSSKPYMYAGSTRKQDEVFGFLTKYVAVVQPVPEVLEVFEVTVKQMSSLDLQQYQSTITFYKGEKLREFKEQAVDEDEEISLADHHEEMSHAQSAGLPSLPQTIWYLYLLVMFMSVEGQWSSVSKPNVIMCVTGRFSAIQ